jgi:hypothetical protein
MSQRSATAASRRAFNDDQMLARQPRNAGIKKLAHGRSIMIVYARL